MLLRVRGLDPPRSSRGVAASPRGARGWPGALHLRLPRCVTNLATPSLACNEAGRFLDTSTDRWRHVVGVAKAARAAGATVAPEDVDLLVAAAWLHDIG